MKQYVPHPIDLTKIRIDKSLAKDIERIAQDIHDTWAKQRALQGWQYGERYDSVLKKHPCMMEYEDLPESEKDMDRATVEQTIRMLLWLGYSIEKRG